MLAGRRMPEEVCPVRDELLGELYHADENCVSIDDEPDEEGCEPV